MARQAVVNVEWKEYGLETAITLDAPDPYVPTRTKLSIDNISGLINTASYSHVNPSQEEIYYQITLSDDLGTTEEEFVEQFQDGSLSVTCSNSSGGVRVTNGHLMICFYNHTTALRTLTITASDGNVSGTYSVVDPPYSSTFTLRYYNNTQLTTSRTSQPAFDRTWRGITCNVCITNSGTSLSESVFKEFVDAGIITGTFFTDSHVSESGNIWTYLDTSGGKTTNSVTVQWNGGSASTFSILHSTVYEPASPYTYYYILYVFLSALASGNPVAILKAWRCNNTWNTSYVNTYAGTITQEELAEIIGSDCEVTGFRSTAIGFTDTRLSAEQLASIFRATSVSSSSTDIYTTFYKMNVYGYYESELVYECTNNNIATNCMCPTSNYILNSSDYNCDMVITCCPTLRSGGSYSGYMTRSNVSHDPDYLYIEFMYNSPSLTDSGNSSVYSYLVRINGTNNYSQTGMYYLTSQWYPIR